MSTILIVLLILILLGGIPFSHAHYGYAGSGALGTVLIVLLILALLGKL